MSRRPPPPPLPFLRSHLNSFLETFRTSCAANGELGSRIFAGSLRSRTCDGSYDLASVSGTLLTGRGGARIAVDGSVHLLTLHVG